MVDTEEVMQKAIAKINAKINEIKAEFGQKIEDAKDKILE